MLLSQTWLNRWSSLAAPSQNILFESASSLLASPLTANSNSRARSTLKSFKNSNRLWKHHTCQIQITFAHKCTGFIFARLASSNYRGKVHICSQVVWNNHKKGPSATVLAKGRYFVLASQTKMTAVCNCIIVIFFFYGFCGFYRSACLWLHNNFIMHKSSFKISLGFLNRQGTVVLSRCYYTTS